jgi:hypothetical protein
LEGRIKLSVVNHPFAVLKFRKGKYLRIMKQMKQDAPFFQGKDPVLIYVAKKLKEALRLEDTLTAAGIDYGVEADEYRGGIILRSMRVGAFFYVAKEGVAAAHQTMRNSGFTPQAEDAE